MIAAHLGFGIRTKFAHGRFCSIRSTTNVVDELRSMPKTRGGERTEPPIVGDVTAECTYNVSILASGIPRHSSMCRGKTRRPKALWRGRRRYVYTFVAWAKTDFKKYSWWKRKMMDTARCYHTDVAYGDMGSRGGRRRSGRGAIPLVHPTLQSYKKNTARSTFPT